MSTRYVALLRAVNVGGRVVKMDALRKHFAALGLTNVATLIASGNVLFDSAARNTQTLEKKIEAHLGRALGFEVPTFVRSIEELAAIVAFEPFAASELATPVHGIYVSFLREPPTADAVRKLQALRTPDDEFRIKGRELYWLRRASMGESKISPAIFDKALGMPTTSRNITTVRKLAAMPARAVG